jgi:hypothetical protein
MTNTVKYKEWVFEVDKNATEENYRNVSLGGADVCLCGNCKNYAAYRDKVFPLEILSLFNDLGIDYRKEVEIVTWETLPNGQEHIGGWFHFKGAFLEGKVSNNELPNGGYTLQLIPVNDNFSIGFTKGSDLTFFEDKENLIQLEFDTTIPWVIDKSIRTSAPLNSESTSE